MFVAPIASVQVGDQAGERQNIASGGHVLVPPERLAWHVPDPELAREKALERRNRAQQVDDKTTAAYQSRVLERIDTIRRAEQVRLSLEGVIQRTLANNYTLEVLRYNPAIDTTRVVEAEAAFDAAFFTNLVKNKVDRPTGSPLMPADVDQFQSSSGIRKLLASGAQVSGRYEFQRTDQTFAYQEINPEYTSKFIFEMRQPILRNFGIDFNRSLILVSKNDRAISDLTFERQIRDTLRTIEELYWRLVQARRDVVITARLLADFEAIYEYLVARQEFDITPVQILATKADLDQARVDFVRRRDAVLDAEDRLVAIMNDPEINLADDVEIIPDDFPHLERVVVDRLAEVQTALDNRTEIKEQELQIAKARIGVGRAKSAELPRFDLTFRTTFDGLAGSADRSFDEVTHAKFIEYYIGVELEVPIGNRAARAAYLRARLQHAQAVANLQRVFEEVILDVNLAARQLETSFDQIAPGFESAESREREVESIVARAERKDHSTLINELGARQSLANIRRSMLNAMVEYNIALVDLERAKGTLLQYNNVVIPTEVDLAR
jgi:outer membrane protein TolC